MSNKAAQSICQSLFSRLTGKLTTPAKQRAATGTLRLVFAEQEGVRSDLVIVGKREIGLVTLSGLAEETRYRATILPLGSIHNNPVMTGFGPSREEAVIQALLNARRDCHFRLDTLDALLLDIGLWQKKKDICDE